MLLTLIYSNIILTAQTNATIKEPNANDPIWYLTVQYNPALHNLYVKLNKYDLIFLYECYLMLAVPLVSEL